MPAHRKDYKLAVELYESGFSIGQIAQYHGITRQGMYKILRRRNVSFRPHLRYGEENHFYRGGVIQKGDAHDLVERALENGALVRPGQCQNCQADGVFTDGRTEIQAHHTDYNNPLGVMWLCQKCHHEWHRHNTSIPWRENGE